MKNINLKLGVIGGIMAVGASAHALTTLDLTTAGANGNLNGGFFQQVPDQSTGTGVIEPFVRLQNNGAEQGYNTGLSPMPDVKTGTWTHEILLSAVPVVGIGGINYYQFLLDVNQTGANPLISLNALQIYLKTGTLASADDLGDLAAATKVWDLDVGANGDSAITLDFSLNSGSGSGDMFAYIPVTALGTDGTKNLYLYSQFGNIPEDPAEYPTNDGFEEWAVLRAPTTTTSVPDGGATLALLGFGLAGMGWFSRRSKVS